MIAPFGLQTCPPRRVRISKPDASQIDVLQSREVGSLRFWWMLLRALLLTFRHFDCLFVRLNSGLLRLVVTQE